jgi:phage/plasmid-like protein (TIGR03299 family)
MTTETISPNTDTQFSVREVPWMKLGKLVNQPISALEAAKMGGLDFTVSLLPVAFLGPAAVHEDGDQDWDMLNEINPIPKRRAVVADDNGEFMGFVSDSRYTPLQYGEAFSFMDGINPTYVAAGALRGRRQGFMVVKPEVQLNVLGGEDPHDLFAVLRTSHDRSRGVEVSVMPLRGKCMNQLTLKTFAKDAKYRWAIRHTTTMHAKLAEAQKSLEKIGMYAKRYEQMVDRMAHVPLTVDGANNLLKIVIAKPTGKTDRVHNQYNDKLNAILNLWETSPTVGFAGSAWGLVNAVSEYYDWYRMGGNPESRFLNALEGDTHKTINKLANLVLAA